jgi:hypothetical protein
MRSPASLGTTADSRTTTGTTAATSSCGHLVLRTSVPEHVRRRLAERPVLAEEPRERGFAVEGVDERPRELGARL